MKPRRAYMIRNGVIMEAVKINAISGEALELIGNIEMISDTVSLYNDVFGGCRKANQIPLRVSYGGPHIRVKDVDIL